MVCSCLNCELMILFSGEAQQQEDIERAWSRAWSSRCAGLVWSLEWGVGEGTSHGPMSSVRADPRWAGLCPVKLDLWSSIEQDSSELSSNFRNLSPVERGSVQFGHPHAGKNNMHSVSVSCGLSVRF